MNIGKLRHKVTIQYKSKTKDTGGGNTATWVDLATTYAKVTPINTDNPYKANKEQSEITHIVNIRYRSDLMPYMRFLFKGRALYIKGNPINKDERNVELEINCIEGSVND